MEDVRKSPTPFWTLDRITRALRERLCDSAPYGMTALHGISTDTRHIGPGDCFVALVGETFDGHEFLEAAVQSGAAALVVNQRIPLGRFPIPIFCVDDTLLALADLARYRRAAWGKPVVAIVGSNGKTSTKELIRAALGECYTVHATTGNLNNRVGVPLTLLATPDDADLAVVEIGTSVPGEVAILRDIARPSVAVITSVGEEHLDGLGDLAGVFREELSICTGVPIIITPSNQPEIAEAARRVTTGVVTAGLDTGDLHADSWSIDADGLGTIVLDDVTICPTVRGMHNLRNTMLALAVAHEFQVVFDLAAHGIASMTVPAMRAAWHRIGTAMVINDAYNANPDSARAALDMLSGAHGSQRVAILGTMRELGANAARYHDDVARAAVESPADIIAGIGDFAQALRRVAPDDTRIITASDVDELWPRLVPHLALDATILLKASRGVKLERILPYIMTWAIA